MTTAPVGPRKVLIVEDHADSREALALVFEHAGFSVCGAGTVAEALACLRGGASLPVVILSDLVMPGASGAEFIHYLSVTAAFKHIPVVVVTGARLADVPDEAAFVARKPVDPYALVRVVNQVLTGQLETAPELRDYNRLNGFYAGARTGARAAQR